MERYSWTTRLSQLQRDSDTGQRPGSYPIQAETYHAGGGVALIALNNDAFVGAACWIDKCDHVDERSAWSKPRAMRMGLSAHPPENLRSPLLHVPAQLAVALALVSILASPETPQRRQVLIRNAFSSYLWFTATVIWEARSEAKRVVTRNVHNDS